MSHRASALDASVKEQIVNLLLDLQEHLGFPASSSATTWPWWEEPLIEEANLELAVNFEASRTLGLSPEKWASLK